ncbi:nickel pincer cofactor biosynthesis protein LarC [Anaerospora hongkongensis]|uniref:nickel pincer cofactor biosynthesis protein LarC n=1 Tax=Anaerospora hongkongensis TaxID=244830 RepID=UPI0028A2BAC3|nr:nickel pincer cofactor biosynthesis protein LarC [Anaerospora hongkongensis]
MKTVYFDCFAGISGNMLLGAFLDAGVPEERLRSELAKLNVTGYELKIQRVIKQGIAAVHADVELVHHHHDHEHHHEHHHHHRYLPDIYAILDQSALAQAVKDNSKKIFLCLAEAEAKVHGTTADKIHFHEVGAIDSIVDIVGAAFCLHYLGIEKVCASRLQTGSGFVQCSHGQMPVPAPATAELLRNIPYYNGNTEKELVTPTGAAFLAAFGTEFGAIPAGFLSHTIGYGAGGWDLDFPNVLRVHVGELEQAEEAQMLVIEANIDDLNPQIYEYVMEKLLALGARDVWMTPIIMKKSRPATMLSVLAEGTLLESIAACLFAETSTIGIRHYPVQRQIAGRVTKKITTPWGEASVKVSSYQNKICNIAPEFEDCRKLAVEHNIPLKQIQQQVLVQALREDSAK